MSSGALILCWLIANRYSFTSFLRSGDHSSEGQILINTMSSSCHDKTSHLPCLPTARCRIVHIRQINWTIAHASLFEPLSDRRFVPKCYLFWPRIKVSNYYMQVCMYLYCIWFRIELTVPFKFWIWMQGCRIKKNWNLKKFI